MNRRGPQNQTPVLGSQGPRWRLSRARPQLAPTPFAGPTVALIARIFADGLGLLPIPATAALARARRPRIKLRQLPSAERRQPGSVALGGCAVQVRAYDGSLCDGAGVSGLRAGSEAAVGSCPRRVMQYFFTV